jgi:hypothetical protein
VYNLFRSTAERQVQDRIGAGGEGGRSRTRTAEQEAAEFLGYRASSAAGVDASVRAALGNWSWGEGDCCLEGEPRPLHRMNNLLMQLRKLCNHPYLVLEDVRGIPDSLYFAHEVQACGKLFVLDKLLAKLLSQGSKVRLRLSCLLVLPRTSS